MGSRYRINLIFSIIISWASPRRCLVTIRLRRGMAGYAKQHWTSNVASFCKQQISKGILHLPTVLLFSWWHMWVSIWRVVRGKDQGSWCHYYESYRAPDVKEEKNPAAGPGRMSLSLPTCPSESMDPHLDVFSPNLLPTWQMTWRYFDGYLNSLERYNNYRLYQ